MTTPLNGIAQAFRTGTHTIATIGRATFKTLTAPFGDPLLQQPGESDTAYQMRLSFLQGRETARLDLQKAKLDLRRSLQEHRLAFRQEQQTLKANERDQKRAIKEARRETRRQTKAALIAQKQQAKQSLKLATHD
ncbi:MAG: hypothetical protein VKK80_08725 [Prochlorothrix sp.]|nr:hypothetical protein [Prochlorothrix sp.]